MSSLLQSKNITSIRVLFVNCPNMNSDNSENCKKMHQNVVII